MASPCSTGEPIDSRTIEEYLRKQIQLAKEEFDRAAIERDRAPKSKRARDHYAEKFYRYCRALHDASQYLTQGVPPAGYLRY